MVHISLNNEWILIIQTPLLSGKIEFLSDVKIFEKSLDFKNGLLYLPGNYMGKATLDRQGVIIPPLPRNVTNCRAQPLLNHIKPSRWKSMLTHQGSLQRYIVNTYSIKKFKVSNLHVTSTTDAANTLHQCILPKEGSLIRLI